VAGANPGTGRNVPLLRRNGQAWTPRPPTALSTKLAPKCHLRLFEIPVHEIPGLYREESADLQKKAWGTYEKAKIPLNAF
jgi:hypothetical protein